uniref:Transcription factor HNF-4 homolog (inferred by orthology to a D. melanogaster protein) n=1 Tax=Strongyloides venezuelensis TaxID=75913 RepID=A0A0K0FC23_STRVS
MLNYNKQNGVIKRIACEICGDHSDGNHYDIQACRSCTAFFRRSVTFNKANKGMNILSVQPRREPTGSQPNRKNRKISNNNSTIESIINSDTTTNEIFSFDHSLKQNDPSNFTAINGYSIQRKNIEENYDKNCKENTFSEFIKSHSVIECRSFTGIFKEYVSKYIEIRELLKYIHITDPFIIINNGISNLPLKEFTPNDISLLARSDLTSVTLWISQIKEYLQFTDSEKASLLKRFSLRKIMLDHCYMTSKYKDHFEKGNLVMPNYTYIPIDKTGYEKENDNFFTKEIVYNIFRKTFNYAIECIIKPMYRLNLTEEEIVFLYFLILWNRNNEKYVSIDKRYIFLNQRNWALKCLSIHYWEKNISNPDIRLGEITLLLKELEWCCFLHCEDYMTSKCFNGSYLKEKWYDNVCYSKINFDI